MNEEWRAVVGVDGYEVSNLGNLRSYRGLASSGYKGIRPERRTEPKAVKGTVNKDGYIVLSVLDLETKENAQYGVHTFVLEAFVGPKPEGLIARHLNGNPSDNRLENLRWGTYQENRDDRTLHGRNSDGENNGAAKLTWEQVGEIRASTLAVNELMAQYGVGRTAIRDIRAGRSWNTNPAKTPLPERTLE